MPNEYQSLPEGAGILRRGDNTFIPSDERNADWRAFQDWLAQGNTPYPEPPPALADYQAAIQACLDAAARSKGYDSGVSLVSYVGSTVAAWTGEASTFIAWRDEVWAYAYAQLAAVEAQQRLQPTPAELVSELPAIEWPT